MAKVALTAGRAVHPVIMCGGSGTRLWPVSRSSHPKQLIAFTSQRSLLQDTILRTSGDGYAPPIIVCNDEYRFLVAHQLLELGVDGATILLEPVSRNTAATACVAALKVAEASMDDVMVLLPSDHMIDDVEAFRGDIEIAAAAARAGHLVSLGIRPTAPETGFGYIRSDGALPGLERTLRVKAFIEKPDALKAAALIAEGTVYWNAGILVCTPRILLAELGRMEPVIADACRKALAASKTDFGFCRLDPEEFGKARSVSVDHALLERTHCGALVLAAFPWKDLGTWRSLWESAEQDSNGNAVIGDVVLDDVRGSYLRSDGPLLAGLGLRDVVAVASKDAILIADKSQVHRVGSIVEELKRRGGTFHSLHTLVHRPWGTYETLATGPGYKVKHIVINPAAKLSLQFHKRRAEHWVVLEGAARVTRGDKTFDLEYNESTYIPVGTQHRLENPVSTPLRIIEIQSGDYVEEDDIVRLADTYGR